MNVGISVWRAIMKDEFITPFPSLHHLFIKTHLGPFLETRGLTLAEVRLLGKIGSRQINRFLKIQRFRHNSRKSSNINIYKSKSAFRTPQSKKAPSLSFLAWDFFESKVILLARLSTQRDPSR